MSLPVPLSFLRTLGAPSHGVSLGDIIKERLDTSGIGSLLDCLCSSGNPAIFAPDPSRIPLRHSHIHSFVSSFVLPNSPSRARLGPNDRIMVVLPTGPENALALLSLACYFSCAPVNASCTAAELKEDAVRLRAKAVVTTRDAVDRLELLALQNELDCEVIVIEGRKDGPAGFFDMEVLGGGRVSTRPSRLHGLDDYSLILHTSGTSGKKKVVPYTLRSLIIGAWAVVHSWDLQESDINMNMMPLFHVGGIVRNLLAPMLSGGSAIMCAGFDPIAFWNLAFTLKATWYYAAPTIHHAILSSQPDQIDAGRDTNIRMICNAAGGLLPSLAIEMKERFTSATILPSYGMTECMPIASPPTTYQLERPGCSGIACGPHLSIRDPFNRERELPPGQTGAVSVRGIPTFEGYETSPDPNVPLDVSAFSSEGWFDSGDMGYMDEDGYLYITGRSKEIINKGGEVISPFEVEEAIMNAASEFVKTTLAFGVEHEVLQECIGVVIVPQPGARRIALSQLHDLLKDYLHPSKWPFAVVYMKDLPKNAAGKPLRIKLGTRLGLGPLSDSTPLLKRHIEADVPPPTAALSEPIKARPVCVRVDAVEAAFKSLPQVHEIGLRSRQDASLEAFVSVGPGCGLTSDHLSKELSRYLHGYSIPSPIHVLEVPLARDADLRIDYATMERAVQQMNASDLTEVGLTVRDIFSTLLNVDAGNIGKDSDFFLMGGNSLLLGKLSYMIRKQTGADLVVADLFSNSTVQGVAGLIEASDYVMADETTDGGHTKEGYGASAWSSSVTLGYNYGGDLENSNKPRSRGQNHPLSLMVQALPVMFFYPFKSALTWTLLLFILSYLTRFVTDQFFHRLGVLLCAIVAGRFAARTIAPLTAIIFKWIVIGRFKRGTYKTWSTYYLRWWLVNQALRLSGRGIFSVHPVLERLYYRMLGAHIGSNVEIDKSAILGEYDLLYIDDGARIDKSLLRCFCVERDGFIRLDPIHIGRDAVVNTYSQISPGSRIADRAVIGPHASSHEPVSPPTYAAYNRTMMGKPHILLQLFIAWPIFLVVFVASYVPWVAVIYLMLQETDFVEQEGNALENVIFWFASPERVAYHALARVVRATITPLVQVLLGIIVKRVFGLNKPGLASHATQLVLLRRYINGSLLSQQKLKAAFNILGSHYQMVTIVFRAMGAKVGKRVYWPGSGLYVQDPELLEIGNDVVFGSRSELFTTDQLGTDKITIGDGAMIADRVVLLPGTSVGRRTVMGSGALGRRGAIYEDGSTWMGSQNGEAIFFSKAKADVLSTEDTITPFGRAYYRREADYFVFPYLFIFILNFGASAVTAGYWSIAAVAAAQMLREIATQLPGLNLFDENFYRIGILYGWICGAFIVALNVQAILAILWVVATKWLIIGRRKDGRYDWNKSSYCQRWQLHLTISRIIYRGYGNGGILAPLAGSAYIVWYYRMLGAKIGKNCGIWVGGKCGLMTEPDMITLGDEVTLDNSSVVAHINSRGNFSLNSLKIGDGCAMRNGSRLLSGASMEDGSMLCEHTLLASGDIAESGCVYAGWPSRRLDQVLQSKEKMAMESANSSYDDVTLDMHGSSPTKPVHF